MVRTRVAAILLSTVTMAATIGVAGLPGTVEAATGTKFGTLSSPCGKGSPSGSPDRGVTASTIKVGYGDDAGYQNTNSEIGVAVKAMIAWCNAQGGINGRQIVGDYQDAAIFDAKAAVDKTIANGDFMLVGEGWAFDSAGEADRLAADLVAVPAFTASTDTENAWEMYQSVPNPADWASAGGAALAKTLFGADVVSHACAYRIDDLPGGAAKTSTIKDEYAFTKAGWTFMGSGGSGAKSSPGDFASLGCDQNVSFLAPISAASTINNASLSLKNAGAKALLWSAIPNAAFTDLLADDAANHYNPVIVTESGVYAPSLAKWNKKGYANNVYVRMALEPLEAAASVPAVKQYVTLVGGATKASILGEQATSSFLLWATAAKACGNNLTRQCVVNYLGNVSNFSGVNAWTGGGLQGAANPASNLPSQCTLLLHLKGTAWTQVAPSKLGTFSCNASIPVDTTSLLPYLPNGTGTGITLNGRHVGSGGSAIKPQ